MILHILTDSKFKEYVIKQFEEPDMCSEFVVISDNDIVDSSRDKNRVRTIRYGSPAFESFLSEIGRYKAIILHGLFWPWDERIIQSTPDTVKIAWMFWGGEIYGRKGIHESFLMPSTKKLYAWKQIKRFLKGSRYKSSSFQISRQSLKRIDYCLTDIEEEFLFAKKYIGSDMKHLWYNYYSIEETIGDLMNSKCNGDDILVGNSCTIECNHIDAFKLLERLGNKRRVICPMSYGETWLRTVLLRKGEKTFKTSFHPLTEFVPRQEYNKILSGCSSAIMAHFRPQGLGNIITMLWLGVKVFMSEKSMQYAYLKKLGLCVYTIEHDISHGSFNRLCDKDIEQNRLILQSIYGLENMTAKNKIIVKTLES